MSFKEKASAWLEAHPQMLPYGFVYKGKSGAPRGITIEERTFTTPYTRKDWVATDAFVSDDWRIGGQTGGSCWDEGPHEYDSVDGEKEADFAELEAFIDEYYPDFSYRMYRELNKKFEYVEFTSDSDYYGNYTRSMCKMLRFSDFEEVLSMFEKE